jgi:hypothetical protein
MKRRSECLLNDQEQARIKRVEDVTIEGTWKRMIQDVYAPHQTQQQMYQRSLENRISILQQQTQRRKRKLEFLRKHTNKLIAAEESMACESKRLQQIMEETDRREETEDEDVSNLAMMIKAALTKVRISRYYGAECLLMCMYL